MSNLFTTAVTMLNAARVASLSDSVVYRRGEQELTILATASKRDAKPFELLAGYGQSFNRIDFIFDSADLTFGEPELGDEIDYNGDTYEVFEIDGKTFKKCDPVGVMLRVFAVEQ